jgi:hypothetical protein
MHFAKGPDETIGFPSGWRIKMREERAQHIRKQTSINYLLEPPTLVIASIPAKQPSQALHTVTICEEPSPAPLTPAEEPTLTVTRAKEPLSIEEPIPVQLVTKKIQVDSLVPCCLTMDLETQFGLKDFGSRAHLHIIAFLAVIFSLLACFDSFRLLVGLTELQTGILSVLAICLAISVPARSGNYTLEASMLLLMLAMCKIWIVQTRRAAPSLLRVYETLIRDPNDTTISVMLYNF